MISLNANQQLERHEILVSKTKPIIDKYVIILFSFVNGKNLEEDLKDITEIIKELDELMLPEIEAYGQSFGLEVFKGHFYSLKRQILDKMSGQILDNNGLVEEKAPFHKTINTILETKPIIDIYVATYVSVFFDLNGNNNLPQNLEAVNKIISDLNDRIKCEKEAGKQTLGFENLKNEFCFLLWQIKERM